MLMTIKEVAEMFQVHPRTIKRWKAELGFPHIKIEGTVRFDEQQIREWIQKKREVKQ